MRSPSTGEKVAIPHVHTIAQLVVHPPSTTASHKEEKLTSFLPAHPSSEKAWHSVGGESTYDASYSLPLGGVDRDFTFMEDEARRHLSYLLFALREWLMMLVITLSTRKSKMISSSLKT